MQSTCKAPAEIAPPVNHAQILFLRLLFVGYFAYLTLLLLAPDPFRMVGSSKRFLHLLDLLYPLAHCLSFTILTLLALLAGRPMSRLAICLSLMGYATATEFLQMLIPPRTAEWGDWLQDIAGIAVGLGVVWLMAMIWNVMRKVKRRRAPKS